MNNLDRSMLLILVIAFVATVNVWAVRRGHPNAVWVYCNVLGWCEPMPHPYCPPDPKECG